MSKIYTLRKQVGDDGVSVSVAASTSKERLQEKLGEILDENRRYLDEVNNLESKIGEYYFNSLRPFLNPTGCMAFHPYAPVGKQNLGLLENKYIEIKFPGLFDNRHNCTGTHNDPSDYGFYYTKYTRQSGMDWIPVDNLIKIVENRPKISDIKEPEHYSSEYDFSIEESELI